MKKTISLILILFAGIFLVSCNGKKDDNNVKVYFYKYTRAYRENKEDPALISTQIYEKGSKVDEPEDPVRPGYIFEGWFKEVNHENEWNFDTDVADKNVVLYAKWESIAYKITLELNGGKLRSSFTGEFDENDIPYYEYRTGTTQALQSPTRTGYEFLGWYKTETIKTGDKQETQIDQTTSSDTTYYAHWKLLTLTIRFDVNAPAGVTVTPSQIQAKTIKYGDVIDFVLPTAPGYKFLGWNTRKNGSGVFLYNRDVFNGEADIRVYGQWTKDSNA